MECSERLKKKHPPIFGFFQKKLPPIFGFFLTPACNRVSMLFFLLFFSSAIVLGRKKREKPMVSVWWRKTERMMRKSLIEINF
jgi:hypothetical protein